METKDTTQYHPCLTGEHYTLLQKASAFSLLWDACEAERKMSMNRMNTYVLMAFITLLVVDDVTLSSNGKDVEANPLLKVYQVNKKVSTFAEVEDLSTPEDAYATINHLRASGDRGFWRRVNVKESVAGRPAEDEGKQKVSEIDLDEWLNSTIIEVRIYNNEFAVVSAEWRTDIITRRFEYEDGQWKNMGEEAFRSQEEAREKFYSLASRRVERPKREEVDHPRAYLETYVDFLKTKGQEPKAFVMNALAKHRITIIGEIHHRPRYWSFNSSLVADPDFAEHIGTICMELPANNQMLIERFLAGEKCNELLVIETLRDMLWMGWPDQSMLDFFIAVWNANQRLETEKKLRIVLVDMERPWEKIRKRQDWRAYDVIRDQYMADNIIRDIEDNPREKRNRLFLVGVTHAASGFEYSIGDYPLKTAGWYLNNTLGVDQVYAIMQHRCVMTNNGRVEGRVCLGLFDSAFEALGNRPVAFPLGSGPFGEQLYDGQPDEPVSSKYSDGFDGYLYLGPLETERFSSLIGGFYTDEFVEELERRYRMMYGKGWAESNNREESSGENFVNWMSVGWGQLRKWRDELGPIDAWKHGDNWESEVRKQKHEYAFEHPEVIADAAKQLFDAIRNADYEHHQGGDDCWSFLPPGCTGYLVHSYYADWVKWICETFVDNPIDSVELGEVSRDQNGLPTLDYTVRLKDGRELKGDLPFRYDPRCEEWTGIRGLDWHLQYRGNDIHMSSS